MLALAYGISLRTVLVLVWVAKFQVIFNRSIVNFDPRLIRCKQGNCGQDWHRFVNLSFAKRSLLSIFYVDYCSEFCISHWPTPTRIDVPSSLLIDPEPGVIVIVYIFDLPASSINGPERPRWSGGIIYRYRNKWPRTKQITGVAIVNSSYFSSPDQGQTPGATQPLPAAPESP